MAHATLADFRGAIDLDWGDERTIALVPGTTTAEHTYREPGRFTITAIDAAGAIATVDFLARAGNAPVFELSNDNLATTALLTSADHVPVLIIWE